jgi:putative membrane protein
MGPAAWPHRPMTTARPGEMVSSEVREAMGVRPAAVRAVREVTAMFWYGHDPGGWGWFAMSAGMILFWAVLITVGVLLFRALSRPGGGQRASYDTPPTHNTPPTHDTPSQRPRHDLPPAPEQVLAERFARGEIDEDEYRRRLGVLRETAGPRLTKS